MSFLVYNIMFVTNTEIVKGETSSNDVIFESASVR